MAEAVLEKKKYTYQDYLKLPDEVRYELIEGKLIMTPSPNIKHQRISRKIEFMLEKYVTENSLGEVFDAPCDVYLDDENVVQPDILFISKERAYIIGEKNIQGAPDLVIEIVSEASIYRDSVQKKKLYAKHGVKEYWIVAPDDQMIEVYILREPGQYELRRTYYENDVVESEIIKGFKISMKDIFG
ncbi:Uma2 family endonuclease [Thermodesulfovibrio sp. 3907-1M]|uniref:Uma2 family endonuclease n=1 Tax=Thermodesulfovibrio autotrophicus TaxID=3118333 RepID=A0AAU8GZP2_9BACT